MCLGIKTWYWVLAMLGVKIQPDINLSMLREELDRSVEEKGGQRKEFGHHQHREYLK